MRCGAVKVLVMCQQAHAGVLYFIDSSPHYHPEHGDTHVPTRKTWEKGGWAGGGGNRWVLAGRTAIWRLGPPNGCPSEPKRTCSPSSTTEAAHTFK